MRTMRTKKMAKRTLRTIAMNLRSLLMLGVRYRMQMVQLAALVVGRATLPVVQLSMPPGTIGVNCPTALGWAVSTPASTAQAGAFTRIGSITSRQALQQHDSWQLVQS